MELFLNLRTPTFMAKVFSNALSLYDKAYARTYRERFKCPPVFRTYIVLGIFAVILLLGYKRSARLKRVGSMS